MTKLIVVFVFAVAAGALTGCTGGSQANLLPKADSSHALNVQDNGGGGIPVGGGDPGGTGP